MIRGDKYIILTEVHDVINVDFYEEEDDDGVFKGVKIRYQGMLRDEYIIPRTIWVLSDDKLESYDILGANEFNMGACTIDYDLSTEYELNEAGKDMYNIYIMMSEKNKEEDIKVDIDEFLEQYT
jgi:hypothetical protein